MIAFSNLLERLAFQSQRNAKIRLLMDYLTAVPDPARGYGLAAVTGGLSFHTAKPALLKSLIEERIDPVLFRLSYDYVGDLAETIALLWPESDTDESPPSLDEVVTGLGSATKLDSRRLLRIWLDALDSNGRIALLKLVTQGLRVGVSARLAKIALAEWSAKPIGEIEEIWPAMKPPYTELFAWLTGKAERPIVEGAATFRPVMLAHPLEPAELTRLSPEEFAAEWKWDGVRVQATRIGAIRRLFSRSVDDISVAFPDVLAGLPENCVIDGELLILREGRALSFAALQQRLNRKRTSERLLVELPAGIRAYDLLFLGGKDLRSQPWTERRVRLEELSVRKFSAQINLSPLIHFSDWEELRFLRANPPLAEERNAIEGIMLKRKSAAYEGGRIKGQWYKWKRDPHTIDCVLIYAERGHGKRSALYSDYTFGVWRRSDRGAELVPVGKAYFGFTDEELRRIDRYIRDNLVRRFGPVAEVVHRPDQGLVFEVAFEGLNRSSRHKSGIAMRFPRISRLRWDKSPAEADHLESLFALLAP